MRILIKTNQELVDFLKDKNSLNTITVYDGINSNWSSGRIKRPIDLDEDKIEWYNKNGVGVALTFANPIIDLNPDIDPGVKSLNILNRIGIKHNIKNSVILINEELREYTERNFSNLELIYSITGHPNDILPNKEMIDYYLDLETKYNKIVPKFELVFNKDFTDKINTSLYEPIMDDTCIHGCPVFREHLFEMARINREHKDPWNELGEEICKKTEECWIPTFDPDLGSKKDIQKYGCKGLGMDIYSEDNLIELFDLGYRSLKLTGRELPDVQWVQNMSRNINTILKAYAKWNVK